MVRKNAHSLIAIIAISTLCAPSGAAAQKGDIVAGEAYFQQHCLLCHTAQANDSGGAQGPALNGLLGRPAASAPSFAYTEALKNSHLTWTQSTLNRFLAAPSAVVPGTAMGIDVPDGTDRDNLIAYLGSTPSDQSVADQATANLGSAQQLGSERNRGSEQWREDFAGRAHRFDLTTLPAPFATPAAQNPPKVVPRPPDAQLSLPPRFQIAVFASDLQGPRKMIAAPNGDIFVTETRGDRISILHPSADGSGSSSTDVYAKGLKQPFGILFYPNATRPTWLYVADTNRVIRYAFKTGDLKPQGEPEVVIPELPSGSGHSTRDIAFSADGKRLFVSVGSGSNVAEGMSKKTPDEIRAWESQRGLGAAWDDEENRAAVLSIELNSHRPARIFASGIRNCVSLTIQPRTGALWCTTNERDGLGDDLVPDYSTRVREGAFYGWPWYYMGAHEDPRLKGQRADLADKVTVPDVPYQAHSAALNLVFYTATHGKSAFPAEYVGDAFAVFHGSWNRATRTGHKVVRVRMRNGSPTGEYDDFLTGFIVDDATAWGRPVAATELHDGSVLLSDDGANVIYRISYAKGSDH